MSDLKHVHFLKLQGAQFQNYLQPMGRLRIEVFREFPYLYEGDLDYETRYLSRYARSNQSHALLAFAGDELIGATTLMSLEEEDASFREPLEAKGFKAEQVVYFGESLLKAKYRGLGMGKRFMHDRLELAESLPGRRFAAFCAVIRPSDHPLRPKHYQPLNDFWLKYGFAPLKGAIATFDWREIGDENETTKQLQFWVKTLKVESKK